MRHEAPVGGAEEISRGNGGIRVTAQTESGKTAQHVDTAGPDLRPGTKQACEALIAELGLSERVTLITDYLPEDECLALLQMADLIVYPYQKTQESSSAAVRMGLASGRPVAVTPLYIFDDVADAVHTLPGVSVAAMTEGLRSLLADPDEISRQTVKTATWVAVRQWPLLSQRLLDIIEGASHFETGLPIANAVCAR